MLCTKTVGVLNKITILRTRQLRAHWSPVPISRQGRCCFLICSHVITALSISISPPNSPREKWLERLRKSPKLSSASGLWEWVTQVRLKTCSSLCYTPQPLTYHASECYGAGRAIACNEGTHKLNGERYLICMGIYLCALNVGVKRKIAICSNHCNYCNYAQCWYWDCSL